MKFLLRFTTVLAVAVLLGLGLYHAVQALPDDAPSPNPASIRIEPQNEANGPGNPTFRPEGPQREREGGLRWRSLAQVFGHVFMFVLVVFVAVTTKNLMNRKSNGKKNDGG